MKICARSTRLITPDVDHLILATAFLVEFVPRSHHLDLYVGYLSVICVKYSGFYSGWVLGC
jgi:hypothetical protein